MCTFADDNITAVGISGKFTLTFIDTNCSKDVKRPVDSSTSQLASTEHGDVKLFKRSDLKEVTNEEK